MSATSTLRYTSSRTEDNAVRIARVAAAGRVASERAKRDQLARIRKARATLAATKWVAAVVADGAERVGFKICDDYGKHRFVATPEHAVDVLVNNYGEDVEAWGIRADGEYCAEVW
jgi:hypothetical protein